MLDKLVPLKHLNIFSILIKKKYLYWFKYETCGHFFKKFNVMPVCHKYFTIISMGKSDLICIILI